MQSNPKTDSVLIQEGYMDYKLPAGAWVWITVGKLSIRLQGTDSGGCRIEAYGYGDENGTVLIDETVEA